MKKPGEWTTDGVPLDAESRIHFAAKLLRRRPYDEDEELDELLRIAAILVRQENLFKDPLKLSDRLI